jgi:IMP cyclohydrolase
MYVGRIVAIGKTNAGSNAVLYRVSSRSFPNRQAVETSTGLAIIPRSGHEGDLSKNPYIAYNALRLAGDWAVASNGSHTDPIAEKVAEGIPVRDALVQSLLALDYEKDDYNTPRIAAAVPLRGDKGWLGIVRKNALVVKEVDLVVGQALYLATYEADDVRETQRSAFDAITADEAARFLLEGGHFAQLEKPVTSAAALADDTGFNLGTASVE